MKIALTNLTDVCLVTGPQELLRTVQVCWGSSIKHCSVVKTEVVKFVIDMNEGKLWRIPQRCPVVGELGKLLSLSIIIIIIIFSVKKLRAVLMLKMPAKQAYFVTSARKSYLLITLMFLRWRVWMASKCNTLCSYYYSETYALLLIIIFTFLTGLDVILDGFPKTLAIKDKLCEICNYSTPILHGKSGWQARGFS